MLFRMELEQNHFVDISKHTEISLHSVGHQGSIKAHGVGKQNMLQVERRIRG